MDTLSGASVVLVVEDDESIRDMLRDILDDEGYHVITAEDGTAAMAALLTVRPQLVTLDLDLPGISGEQVLELIRNNSDLHALPVIVISAARQIPHRVQALSQHILRKPFDVNDLLLVVAQLIASAEREVNE